MLSKKKMALVFPFIIQLLCCWEWAINVFEGWNINWRQHLVSSWPAPVALLQPSGQERGSAASICQALAFLRVMDSMNPHFISAGSLNGCQKINCAGKSVNLKWIQSKESFQIKISIITFSEKHFFSPSSLCARVMTIPRKALSQE